MRTIFLGFLPILACGQDAASDAMRLQHAATQRNLTEAVEKIHEGYLDFQPTAEVRSFRAMTGHLLDAQNRLCGALRGGSEAPAGGLEKAALSKAELVDAVKKSGAYCDEALKALTDAKLGEKVKAGAREMTRAQLGQMVVAHGAMHYGNLITYMRLRGMVPPETERAQTKAEPSKPEMVTYYMGFLKRGPKWTPEATPEVMKIQEGHMAHMKKSAEAGALILAGPFADNTELRGILVYKTKDIEEAKKWANSDPAVAAGRLVLEIHPWMTQKGYLP